MSVLITRLTAPPRYNYSVAGGLVDPLGELREIVHAFRDPWLRRHLPITVEIDGDDLQALADKLDAIERALRDRQ